ncbi:hypothetical protein GCM10009626_16880 [Brachybacterium sacelli]
MSEMLSAPATIPATNEETFTVAFAPGGAGDAHMLGHQVAQPGGLGQGHHRDRARPRDQIAVIELGGEVMGYSHYRCSCCSAIWNPYQVPLSQATGAFGCHDPPTPPADPG